MSAPIDIRGLDKAELLQALHRGTRALGMGRLHDRGPLTLSQCQEIIALSEAPSGTMVTGKEGALRFDYVAGRPIKVTFSGDELLHSGLYDRDAGEGECLRIVEELRAKTETK